MLENGFELYHWENAIKLLDKQLELKNGNMHFARLNMFYYEHVKQYYNTEDLIRKEFFEEFIKNGYVFSLENHFFSKNYHIRKDVFRLRKQSFTSYLARLYHYMIGLYMLKLTEDFYKNYYKRDCKGVKRIISYYGGNLTFNNDNKLSLNQNNLYYRKFYRDFKRVVKEEIESLKFKYVISVDLQNFYDEIDVLVLCDMIKEKIKYSTCLKYNYNEKTISDIVNFYKFLSFGKIGIPQGDNDVISSFISHLFLCFFDLEIDDFLKENHDKIKDYKIIRYVDDIYIFIEFNEHLNLEKIKIDNFLISTANKISDILSEIYKLRCNEKSLIFDLQNESDRKALNEKIKKTSLTEYLGIDDDKKKPNDAAKYIIQCIKNLSEFSSLDKDYINSKDETSEILKMIYNGNVQQILRKEDNKKKIRKYFNEIDMKIICNHSSEMVAISCLDDKLKDKLKEKIIESLESENFDRKLVIEFLSKTNMEFREKFMKKIKSDKVLRDILSFGETNDYKMDYFISNYLINIFINQNDIINQIISRRLNEVSKNWNVAFNHLVNEFHSICYGFYGYKEGKRGNYIERNGIKNFDAERVKEFLINSGISNDLVIKVVNLFDRRNNNRLSHSTGLMVSENEYFHYKKSIEMCLKKLEIIYSVIDSN